MPDKPPPPPPPGGKPPPPGKGGKGGGKTGPASPPSGGKGGGKAGKTGGPPPPPPSASASPAKSPAGPGGEKGGGKKGGPPPPPTGPPGTPPSSPPSKGGKKGGPPPPPPPGTPPSSPPSKGDKGGGKGDGKGKKGGGGKAGAPPPPPPSAGTTPQQRPAESEGGATPPLRRNSSVVQLPSAGGGGAGGGGQDTPPQPHLSAASAVSGGPQQMASVSSAGGATAAAGQPSHQMVVDARLLEQLLTEKLSVVQHRMDGLQSDVRGLMAVAATGGGGGSPPRTAAVLGVVRSVFEAVQRAGGAGGAAGTVSKAALRGALLDDPRLLGAPSGRLLNQPELSDVLACERLVRWLGQEGPPYEVSWGRVEDAFRGGGGGSGGSGAFEEALRAVFESVRSPATGRASVSHLVRRMEEVGGAGADGPWGGVAAVLEASPPGWDVSVDELLLMREHVSAQRERGGGGSGGGGGGGGNLLLLPSSPLSASAAASASVHDAGSPGAAKRRLRVDAVSERLRGLRAGGVGGGFAASLGGTSPSSATASAAAAARQQQSLTARAAAAEQRLGRVLSGEHTPLAARVEEEAAALEAAVEEEARAAQRGQRALQQRAQGLRERAGSPPRGGGGGAAGGDTAPRVFRYLTQATEGLGAALAASRSPVTEAREGLALEGLLADLRAKSELLDDIIHQHGLREEQVTHRLRAEVQLLNAAIEEERGKRQHMESVFVSLMESIISRLYNELNEAFTDRQAMDARLNARLQSAVSTLGGRARVL